ncbi:FusB/FusC family EF-G-binding protein [Ectobacillus ponti]|uniref:FusB/FusC family EF-G-binding protein n=1 Tax=Ectobacillus ponti TaxID=2961894 RepID=A0AA41X997_9BACI|nr:FusB/FusC family EF-G-binding protein [Ectobacillus ponti]MCP8967726.1 FusB/FusC family EF-G-binding protein [Ectobacillus ponti]
MEPFIRSEHYNFIKSQVQVLINGHASANDRNVLAALRAVTWEKVAELFGGLDGERADLLGPIVAIRSKEDAEPFLAGVKPYVIPFPAVTEGVVKKLFPKAKKLKAPSLEGLDLREFPYMGWDDKGSGRKYIVTAYKGKLTGIHGTFSTMHKKSVCALCNRHGEVGLFMSEKKGSTQDAFVRKGNYICRDSHACARQLTTLERLHDLIERLS